MKKILKKYGLSFRAFRTQPQLRVTFKDEATLFQDAEEFIEDLNLVVDISEKQKIDMTKDMMSFFRVLNDLGYDVEIHIREKL